MSFTKRLAQRNIPAAPIEVSVPFEVTKLSLECLELEQAIAEYNRVHAAMESISAMSEVFLKEGVDEAKAAMYQVSVESVMRTAGIDFPVDQLAPSFESVCGDYSTEAEKKTGNVLQRAWAWLMNALKAIYEKVVGYIKSIGAAAGSGAERCRKLKEKAIEKFKKKDKPAESKPSTEAADHTYINLDHRAAGYLGGKTGKLNVSEILNEAQADTRKAAADVLGMTRKVMAVSKGLQPERFPDGKYADTILNDFIALTGMKVDKEKETIGRDIKIGGQIVELKGSHSMTGGLTLKVGFKKLKLIVNDQKFLTLSESETIAGLDLVTKAYEAHESIAGPMTTAANIFSNVGTSLKGAYDKASKVEIDNKDESKALIVRKTAGIFNMVGNLVTNIGQLPVSVISAYMHTVWAMERYLEENVSIAR